jgi:hypothetical protein
MDSYFKCDVRYLKANEQGEEKEVTESYLVKAINYTEAETLIHKKITENVTKNFVVMKIDRFRVTDMIDVDFGADYYLAKSSFLTVSERGKEKKVVERALVNANSIHDALNKLKEYHKTNTAILHIRIESMAECPVVEVFN